ncbi:MAG TPA: DUF4129 domain-containing protein [Streptosporangiaceae bacterium]|nr:DUF4129 domain-containing protein [Streptosporangiaceae bacterium]
MTDRTAAARTAVVAVLLAVAVTGLRAQGAFSHLGSSALANAGGRVISSAFGVAEGAGLVACVVVLALGLPGIRRRRRKAEAREQRRPPAPWWAKAVIVLCVLTLLTAPWVILLAGRHRRTSATPLRASGPLVPRPGASSLAGASGSGSDWPLLVGMALAVAAVIVLAVLARRRRRRQHGLTPHRAATADPLAVGLIAGHDALLAGREPREAIIACYAAMERGFAAAGSVPDPADTPAEVLTRASDAGLIRSDSASVLTGLFRRARYSSQPMTGADSGAAASALAQMRADLDLPGAGGGQRSAP